jgi:NAD(P)-dependent dehydrogenase (short-subunit alcohol dehydrogenase family)
VTDTAPSPIWQDKVALVTGGASGIGAASARHLASLGAHVVVIDLSEVGARTVADEVGGTAAVLDVSDPEAWIHLINDVMGEYGGIDFAHLNAGIVTTPHPYDIIDVTVAQYRRVMGVNLDGVLIPTIALAKIMEPRGGGSIVATASLAGVGPYYDDPFYAATKHAIIGFVRSAGPQLRERGVRLHAICPAAVKTALIDDFIAQRLEEGGRPALDPSEVAVAVAEMLASDDTGFVRTIIHGKGVQDFEFRAGVMPPPGT